MTITLTYTKEDGTQEQIEFEDDVTSIDFSSRSIMNIDLSPLVACTTTIDSLEKTEGGPEWRTFDGEHSKNPLQYLDLSNNELNSIDLKRLSVNLNNHTIECLEISNFRLFSFL